MKKHFAPLFALPLALLLAAGSAHAQFKAQTKSRDLGSGISPGTAANPVPPSATVYSVPSTGSDKPASAETVVQEIANCVLAGLPADWTMAQVDVREVSKEKGGSFEAVYSYLDAEGKAGPFTPCDQKQPALNVYKLNSALDPSKRNWVRATLVFSKEGKFELQYDYPPKDEPKAEKAPAAPTKDAKKAAAKKN